MPLLCVGPRQKSIFCGADFGSAIALNQGCPTRGPHAARDVSSGQRCKMFVTRL